MHSTIIHSTQKIFQIFGFRENTKFQIANPKYLITLLFVFIMATGASAQQTLTLPEAIELARLQSVDAAVALNQLKHRIGNTARIVPTCCLKLILAPRCPIIEKATTYINPKTGHTNTYETTRYE